MEGEITARSPSLQLLAEDHVDHPALFRMRLFLAKMLVQIGSAGQGKRIVQSEAAGTGPCIPMSIETTNAGLAMWLKNREVSVCGEVR